jgi:purine-binding chemotaxis protein CheW
MNAAAIQSRATGANKVATLVAAPPEPLQYLTFMLAGEMFAIGILAIKEIIEYGHLTEVPMMPASVRGVINLRGAVVPVIDLQARFGRPASAVTKRTCIVIVETAPTKAADDGQVIGVVVDAVSEVLELPASEIEPPPSFGSAIRSDFVCGMAKVRGKFVIVLDVANVLAVEDFSTLVDLPT